MVITTHGHPDHFGQVGSFPNAQHFFNNFVYTGNKFTKSEFTGGEIQITPNVKLWQTPGHTPQDVSAIVSNVPVKGTVAIVGDLILSANDLLDSHEWEQSAWNVQIGLKNRNRVVCAANHIVPGHGRPFIVTQQMKNLAQCESVGNPNTGANNIGSVTATVPTGRMKLYPGSSSPLRCFSNSECLQFPGFTNCAHSIRFDTLVCCSTTSCP
uniref:Metallo-beta-lactamase domain-containing protein n=1 Tax=Plectus sambesii TaxID=2011161 RepID=A0A914WV20_9BILA